MQTSYFLMISVFAIVTMGVIIQFPIASSDSGSLTQLYTPRPDLTRISLSLNDTFQQTSQNSTKDLHFRFFDANNNSTINNVTFFINVTKNSKVLMHDLFYTSTGSMILRFSPGNDIEKWIVYGTNEPTLGGWMSKNDTLHITGLAFTEGTYNIHVKVLSLFYVNELVDQSNPPKFDSWWSVDNKGNISKYDNSTMSFGSTTPSVEIKDESPLKQFKSGIASKDISCRQDLLLIFKSSNEEPVCIKPDNAKKLESRGWAISYYHDPGAKPKINLYDYSYDGIDKDDGIVSINNQTFYQTTLGYSAYDLPKKSSTSFHDVIFTFPQGSLNTPGASFVMLDMKFQDGFEEIYGGQALVQNGTATMIGGIPIPTQYGPRVATNSVTILGNHTTPQAGITIYHDKIKLLVSVDQLLTKDNNVVNSIAPKKTTIFDTGITPLSANVTGTNFTVNYNIERARVLEMAYAPQSKSVIVSIQTTGDGKLVINLPRTLLDSKSAYSNQDTQFIVLVDNKEVKYAETTSLDSRTLTIPFEFGAKKIEIISTQNI